jgi:hypothetical protein
VSSLVQRQGESKYMHSQLFMVAILPPWLPGLERRSAWEELTQNIPFDPIDDIQEEKT